MKPLASCVRFSLALDKGGFYYFPTKRVESYNYFLFIEYIKGQALIKAACVFFCLEKSKLEKSKVEPFLCVVSIKNQDDTYFLLGIVLRY